MKIIRFNQKNKFPQCVIALGFFDGVHLAHQSILKSAVNLASLLGIPSLAFTFKQHPNTALKGEAFPNLLTTFEEKIKLIENLGVDFLCWENFSGKFVKISADKFVLDILVGAMKARILVAGYNYHFGYKARGDIKLLEKIGEEHAFKVKVIKAEVYKGKIISSSLIRNLLRKGDVRGACEFLSRNYFVSNNVISGKKRSKLIGIKTANISWPLDKTEIQEGVYAVFVKFSDRFYKGIASYGRSPTFDDEDKKIESNLFDCEENMYGKKITVYFVNKIRKIKKYHSPGDLAWQIQKDIRLAKKILKGKESPKL